MQIAFPKTKVLTAGRDDSGGQLLAADRRRQDEGGPWLRLEGVPHFCELGSIVQADGKHDMEVAARLRAAGAAWARLRPMLFGGRAVGPRRKYRLSTSQRPSQVSVHTEHGELPKL
eukprot:gene24841-biopygen10469